MPRTSLSQGGGQSPKIEARMSDADRDRLLNLAARRGVRQPVLVRELIKMALDQVEAELNRADTGPLTSGAGQR
jgi:predicted DNA-binding protein